MGAILYTGEFEGGEVSFTGAFASKESSEGVTLDAWLGEASFKPGRGPWTIFSRIEAIERHTELGSGFHVASLDLELRGGGDLLCAEQSGTVSAIGFELFFELLDRAVHELRGEPVVRDLDPELSIEEEALLPGEYIDDVGVRLSLYKRLASAEGEGEVDDLAAEMEDRFGPPPEAAKRLVRLMRLKTELRRLRALGWEATSRSVTIHLAEDTPLEIRRQWRCPSCGRS